jgi:hypothetical protein
MTDELTRKLSFWQEELIRNEYSDNFEGYAARRANIEAEIAEVEKEIQRLGA